MRQIQFDQKASTTYPMHAAQIPHKSQSVTAIIDQPIRSTSTHIIVASLAPIDQIFTYKIPINADLLKLIGIIKLKAGHCCVKSLKCALQAITQLLYVRNQAVTIKQKQQLPNVKIKQT